MKKNESLNLKDDIDDLKPHFEFCRDCKYYEPKEGDMK